MDRRAFRVSVLVIAVILATIGAVVVFTACSAPNGSSPVTDPSHPSLSPTPAPSESPTSTATIEGTIVALPTSGDDGTFHLAVEGHGWLPVRVLAGVELVTDATVTVTLRVPETVTVDGSNGDRFRALEQYVTSQRGIVLDIEAITR